MHGFLFRLGAWLATKLAVAALIVALALLVYGGTLYLRDRWAAETGRADKVRDLTVERDRLLQLRAQTAAAAAALQAEATGQEERVRRAQRVIETLRSLESWWERWFGDEEQQAANARQIERMNALKTQSELRVAQLRRAVMEHEFELEQLRGDVARVERELGLLDEAGSQTTHYLRIAWEHSRWYLLAALLVYFLGPTVMKTFAYFVLAPLLGRGRPIRFADDLRVVPSVGPSHVSVDAALWPGEVLRVKEKFLQASDEGLTRRTRFVLDWRIPFTSVACGLIELVEMRNTRAVGEQRVTFSNSFDPHLELALIAVPDGGSIILRPSFLAGVITPDSGRLRIRRRWALFRWQAWVTLQFRFFEFGGPCRLIVAGSRGVRAEHLVEREGFLRPARRTNQEATIGFTPNLDYLPVRAETFWSYYRGMNPLFDDLFAGAGLFILQETSRRSAAGGPGRFWAAMWNGMLKVFGL